MKFLRNIRHSLFGRGEFKGYALYALGEVVLVVIGILIALQIDNWNEHRKNRISNNIMLQQLREENRLNLQELLNDKEQRDTLLPTISHFITFLGSDSLKSDTTRLRTYLAGLFSSTSYSFSENYLMRFINANLSDDSNLTAKLADLHGHQQDLQYISEKGMAYRLDNFIGYLEPAVDFYDLHIYDYSRLASLEFRNKIIMIRAMEMEVSKQYWKTLAQEQAVDSLITELLDGTNRIQTP